MANSMHMRLKNTPPYFLPELSEGTLIRNTRCMIGGLLPLETRTFVLSVPVLEGIRGQQNVYVPPCRRRVKQERQGFFEG